MITARQPTEEDVKYLAENMRGIDKLETRVFCEKGESIEERVQRSVDESTGVLTVLVDDEVLCIFGYQSIIENKKQSSKPKNKRRDIALIWCLGTSRIAEFGFLFVKWGKQFIDAVAAEHDEGVYNMIHSMNRVSKRWLEACGCIVHPGVPLPSINGEPFTWFEKGNKRAKRKAAKERAKRKAAKARKVLSNYV
jgi:hypothetical protein